jgi:hypothetical protein
MDLFVRLFKRSQQNKAGQNKKWNQYFVNAKKPQHNVDKQLLF